MYNESSNITDSQVVENLNTLLASHMVNYQNLRGFHWMVEGKMFYAYHNLFENLYNEAAEQIDEIAERIRILGHRPLHSLNEFLDHTKVEVYTDISNGEEGLNKSIDALNILINIERDILESASESKDEGTVAMMSDLISSHEKHLWMLSASVSNTIEYSSHNQ